MMQQGKALTSVSVSGHITIDMHSLNNEAGEGNQIQTRMVHIVDGEGKLQVVNGISGDMFKHIQAEHLQAIASEDGRVPLCAGCQRFSANRINDDTAFIEGLTKETRNTALLDRVIQHCAMDDLEGILITVGNRSAPRKSTIEFGWVVGLPESTRTESYFHVKYDPAGRGAGSGDQTGANVGQNIFYRPASSGIYAVVLNLDLYRVGWNDISRQHAVDDTQLHLRKRMLLESMLYTFLKPTGAHRNTQHPHILDFNGVISWSHTMMPAPVISPLNGKYREQTGQIVEKLNRIDSDAVRATSFDSSADFAGLVADLLERV